MVLVGAVAALIAALLAGVWFGALPLPPGAVVATRLTLLSEGRVAAHGTPAEVLTPAALHTHYGARAQVVTGPDGPAVLPVR